MQKIWRPPEIYDCRRLYLGEAGCFMEKKSMKRNKRKLAKDKKKKGKKRKGQ